jgi:branched-chain amino acid aminotransferase
MNSGRVVYMNGKFVTESDAKISIFDSALMFGDMVFEMTRSFNKVQFKLKEHLERLYLGMKILRIPLPMSIEKMEQACYETINQNDKVFESQDEHRLMINVSRGPLGIYASVFDGVIEPTVVIADFPLKWTVASMAPLFEEGINAVIPSQRAIPANLLDPKIKNRSRIHYQMANIEVSQCAGENNWALMLDPDGLIAEGTGDNFFIVRNGEILTPEGRNILRGISRDYIFEVAEQLKIPCRECNIEPYDVYKADEAFITATPFCILPTVSLQSITIGDGKMGVVTRALLNQWSKNVGVDIRKQIEEYSTEVKELNSDAPTPYAFKRK